VRQHTEGPFHVEDNRCKRRTFPKSPSRPPIDLCVTGQTAEIFDRSIALQPRSVGNNSSSTGADVPTQPERKPKLNWDRIEGNAIATVSAKYITRGPVPA